MHMKRRHLRDLRFWILLAGVVMIILNSTTGSGSSAATLQSQMPGADAQQLWKYITRDNPYKSWKNFPNLPGRFLHVKENPHGDWIATYINDPAYQSIMAHTNPSYPLKMEYGSLIGKQKYVPRNT